MLSNTTQLECPLRKRTHLWMLIFLGGAVIALMLLAAGLSRIELQPGQPYLLTGFLQLLRALRGEDRRTEVPGSLGSSRVPLTLAVWLLLPILIGFLIVSPQSRRELLKRILSGLVLVILFYVVMRALTDAYGLGANPESSAKGAPPTIPEGSLSALPTFIADPPQWAVVLVSLLLATLIIGGLWFLWRRAPRQENPLMMLAEEAQEAIEELRAGGDLKDTIMRCYVEMSGILSSQRGLARDTSMTPREFEQRLAAAGLRDEHIRQLTLLFERVRYGAKHPDEREEHEAMVCLTAIAQEYGQPS
jgi:hypothetical protein